LQEKKIIKFLFDPFHVNGSACYYCVYIKTAPLAKAIT